MYVSMNPETGRAGWMACDPWGGPNGISVL